MVVWLKQEQLECLRSENSPCHPMKSHNVNSYEILFIPSQNYVVWGYNYISMNLRRPLTYVKGYTK